VTGPSREFTRDSSGDDPFLERIAPEPRVHPRLIDDRAFLEQVTPVSGIA